MGTSKETFEAFQRDDVLSSADIASNVVIKPEEEYAYGFIIEVLTSGLYPDVFHVIREYVQNSFDAIIAWRRMIGDSQVGNVQITIDPVLATSDIRSKKAVQMTRSDPFPLHLSIM
jgi:hypothetical protein